MKDLIAQLISQALEEALLSGDLGKVTLPFIEVEPPREARHGDFATNVALVAASRLKKNPRAIAQVIVSALEGRRDIFSRIEVAGPGFINFFIADSFWHGSLEIMAAKKDWIGCRNLGRGQRVMVEFVSANPTGPLHIGHARGAVVGDVIANMLAKTGHEVYREYYINDAGNQMNNLGLSVYLRGRELLGHQVELGDNCYRGDYVIDIARTILAGEGKNLFEAPAAEAAPELTRLAAEMILNGIKEDLFFAGVRFDQYFRESELYADDQVDKVLYDLATAGFVYREGETLWFRSTAFGDEKDRVVIRNTGVPTYFAADLAYHRDKIRRGFDLLIDIWGADHHGYVPRMTAGMQALGAGEDTLKVILVQLVNLTRDNVPVAMSTRSGEFVTMREVFNEVGRDAARYNFLLRRSDSHLDFDLELVKRETNENPVYYVQYAHARIASIFRLALEKKVPLPIAGRVDLSLLTLPIEITLIKTLWSYPEILSQATIALEPHRLTFYLGELAGHFHGYYNKHKVISDEENLTQARLFLVGIIQTVIADALSVLGVDAPERMGKQQ